MNNKPSLQVISLGSIFIGNMFICCSEMPRKQFWEIRELADQVAMHVQLIYDIHISYKNSYPHKLKNHKTEFYDDLYGTLSYENLYYDEYDEYNNDLYPPEFRHPLLLQCLYDIDINRSLNPFFKAWDEFEFYIGIDLENDVLFLHECCQLIFIIYNKSLCHLLPHGSNRVDLSQVKDLYVRIASLPIGRLIQLLNRIATGLTMAIAMHAREAEGGFFGWIQQNWWIPPTIIAGIITSIVLGKETLEILENRIVGELNKICYNGTCAG